MIKYTKVKSVKEIPLKEKSYEIFNATLFHGTREKMLTMSNEDRKKYYDACHEIRLFAKNIILNISDEIIMLYKKYMRSQEKPYNVSVYTIECYGRASNFEYGDFYMSNNLETAITFTKNIGGEQGNISYVAGNLMRYAKIDIPENVDKAIDVINEFYEDNKNDKKIILVTSGIEVDDISLESGFPLSRYKHNLEDFKEELDDIYESYQMEEAFIHNNNYRINNIDKYTVYAVEEELFDLLKDRFYNVNKEKYLKKALRNISNNKIRFETDYRDNKYVDGSFDLTIKKMDYENFLNLKVLESISINFYPELFEENNISLDIEANIDNNILLEEKILLRLEYYIFKQFNNN